MEIAAVFGLNWKLLLIQAINFGIVLLVLRRFLYGPLLKMIEHRRAIITQGVSDAEEAAKSLKNAEEKCAITLSEASIESNKILDRAEAGAKAKEAELLKEAGVKLRRQEDEARKQAENIKQRAIEESQAEIARLAVLAAEKILIEAK